MKSLMKNFAAALLTGLTVAAAPAFAHDGGTPTGAPQISTANRLTALKTALNLSATQATAFDKIWTDQTARQTATRTYATTALANVATMTVPQRLDTAVAIDAREQADFTAFAASVKAFYATLNATQQSVMNAQFHFGGHH